MVLLPLAAATKKTSVVYKIPIQLEWEKVRFEDSFDLCHLIKLIGILIQDGQRRYFNLLWNNTLCEM